MPIFVHKEVTSNSCFDIACHVFHDITCDESVTFMTALYSCKLLK